MSRVRLAARLAQRMPREHHGTGRSWAAVSLILAPAPESLLLIRRAERGGDPWSGHVALPGGRREASDVDLAATAIRETSEEVGIALDRSQLLGTLDDVAPVTPVLPAIAVRPFVFALDAQPALVLSPEVATAHWEPLSALLHADAKGELELALAGGVRRVPAYSTSAGQLWGMTERILDGFLPMLGT